MGKYQTKEDIEVKLFFEENEATEENINKFIGLKKSVNADMNRMIHAIQAYAKSKRNEDFVSEAGILLTNYQKYCSGLMASLSRITKEMYGQEVWEEIFGNVQMPEAGWTLNETSDFTREIERKYISATSIKQYECAIKKGNPWVKKFKESDRKELNLDDIDALIEKENAAFIELLKGYKKSSRLFFNQKITNSVIEAYQSGEWYVACRRGSKINIIKIPFLMNKYLAETDNLMKRYYACHCPWVRKSILKKQTISKSFCHCSISHDTQWLVDAFGRELDGRVVCSVLEKNSLQCVFEIDIPVDIMNRSKK